MDARPIGINSNYLGGAGRVLKGKPALAAANLEDAPAAETHEALDQANLRPVGRIWRDVPNHAHAPHAISVESRWPLKAEAIHVLEFLGQPE